MKLINICISLAQLHSSLLYRHLLFNELKSMSKVSLLLSLYHPSTYQIHCHPQEAERYNLHFSSVDVLWIDSHSYCHWNIFFQSLSYAHWATATEKHWSVALFFQKVFHFINLTELRLKLSQHFHLVSFFVLLLWYLPPKLLLPQKCLRKGASSFSHRQWPSNFVGLWVRVKGHYLLFQVTCWSSDHVLFEKHESTNARPQNSEIWNIEKLTNQKLFLLFKR